MNDIKNIKCTKIEFSISSDIYTLKDKKMIGPKFAVNFTVFDGDRAIMDCDKELFDTYEQAKEFYDKIK